MLLQTTSVSAANGLVEREGSRPFTSQLLEICHLMAHAGLLGLWSKRAVLSDTCVGMNGRIE